MDLGQDKEATGTYQCLVKTNISVNSYSEKGDAVSITYRCKKRLSFFVILSSNESTCVENRKLCFRMIDYFLFLLSYHEKLEMNKMYNTSVFISIKVGI